MEEYFVEEKTTYDKTLDVLVFVAVFVVTIFLILELLAQSKVTGIDVQQINSIYYYVNIVIFVIFFMDLVRLWVESNGFVDFIKKSWLDILATIPFGLILGLISDLSGSKPSLEVLKLLRVSKLAKAQKIQKLARISKISKEFKAAAHLKRESEEYKKKHRL